jgi:predicted extracellular nuclease
MSRRLRGAASWAINADESPEHGYANASLMAPGAFRSSDHDPLIVGFDD